MKKTLILFIIWILIGLVGSNALPNHQYGLFFICALLFPILTIMFFFRIFGIIIDFIRLFFVSKKKTKLEEDEIHEDSITEQVTLDHPEYIGILTKIDKKRIAEEYLAEQKKGKKYERKKQ